MKKRQYRIKDMLQSYKDMSRLEANVLADRTLKEATNYKICPLCDTDLVYKFALVGGTVIKIENILSMREKTGLSGSSFKQIYECINSKCDFMTVEGVS